MPIGRINTRLSLLVAAAALAPLLAFGGWTVVNEYQRGRDAFVADRLALAVREAANITGDIRSRARLLHALASELQEPAFDHTQQTRVLRNVVLRVGELRELTLFDAGGAMVATSAMRQPDVVPPGADAIVIEGASISVPLVDNDRTLRAHLAVPLIRGEQRTGWLVADIDLDEASEAIRRVRSGAAGRAWLVDSDNRLLAHDAVDDFGVADGVAIIGHPLLDAQQATWRQYPGANGEQLIGAVASVPELGWRLVFEQPAANVFAPGRQLLRLLGVVAVVALVVALLAGVGTAQHFVSPLVRLERATQAVAAGDFRTRVDVSGSREFTRLASSFNTMADRLMKLQDDVKSQERQVMFGRVVAGLFHDLNHPIQNIANNARILLRTGIDADTRDSVQQTIERELVTLRRFMDDVLNIARPRPLEKFPVEINATVGEVVDAMRIEWERSGVQVSGRYTPEPIAIEGDRFALGRVFRNLLANAIQATPSGGRVEVTTDHVNAAVVVVVTDTGAGIPGDRLAAIFDDFVTTRRRGLGLGLASCRRIVEQLGGSISVESHVGRGTTFTVSFPATAVRENEAAG